MHKRPTGVSSPDLLLKIGLSLPGGLEPPTFRLTAERANQLRHGSMPRGPRRYERQQKSWDKVKNVAVENRRYIPRAPTRLGARLAVARSVSDGLLEFSCIARV